VEIYIEDVEEMGDIEVVVQRQDDSDASVEEMNSMAALEL